MRDGERLLILADDFTGACDAAGAFGASRPTRVVIGTPRGWPADVDVLAVDLDVREYPPTEAHAAVEAAARTLSPAADVVFVKIDSTLRGPIDALVAGALSGTHKPLAMVAPAFPEQGRLLVGGRLVVDGRVGPSLARGPSMRVVDAESVDDLRRLVADARAHPEWLLVGSAGLARQLAAGAPPAPRAPCAPSPGPLLIVAGTPATATREQLKRLEGLEAADEDLVVMNTPHTTERDQGEAAAALADAVAAWAERSMPRAVVLTGGATARAVCTRLGVGALAVRGEFAPGIPFGTLEDGVWHGVTVVTKAGGFGAPETLVEVVRALS